MDGKASENKSDDTFSLIPPNSLNYKCLIIKVNMIKLWKERREKYGII